MRHRVGNSWFAVILALFALATISEAQTPVVEIGVVMDGPWAKSDEVMDLFEHEIDELLRGEFDVRFPAEKRFVADWSTLGVTAALNRLLTDSNVDLILAMGPQSSNVAAAKGNLPKPVIAPFVLGAVMPAAPVEEGGSGVRNLVYFTIPAVFERDITALSEIVECTEITVLFHEPMLRAYPDLHYPVTDPLSEIGIKEISKVPVSDSAQQALARIPADTDGVYLTWLPLLSEAEFGILVEGLKDRKLPSFALLGRQDVERGIFAGLMTDALFDRRARRVALTVQRILLGEAPESIPVAIATRQRLSINMETARAIGVSPRWEIVNEADLVDLTRSDIERRPTLAEVMLEAVRVNLDLEAQRSALAAGEQNVKDARANLLPQIDASATAALIDEDRARASMGQAAEQTYSGRLGITQVLYSEPAWANLSVQRHLQRRREGELEALRLDIARDAGIAHLNVLAARTVERIERDNLRLTRENLELARVRAAIGTAGPAEVYRWEAELAQSRRDAIQANAERNLAEMQLNRVLHRPLEEPFVPAEVGLDDPALVLSLAPPFVYVDSRQNFKLLRGYLVAEAMEVSPELRQLDAAIAAQKRHLKSQGLQYYAPTIALQGGVEKVFEERGAGTDVEMDPRGLLQDYPGVAGLFQEPADDLDWQVGLSITLPLFKGGSRYANHHKARRELDRLESQRAAVAEKIEQSLRSELHLSGASYASIRLTRDAAEAASKTLTVVTDAYARGAVSILDLLDAQNAARSTEEAAAIAVYKFLSDYMNVQRAVGRFDVFIADDDRREMIDRLERYILDNGGVLPER